MSVKIQDNIKFGRYLKALFFLSIVMTSCYTLPHKYPKNKPFVSPISLNSIEVKGDFSKEDKNAIKLRLFSQLTDSLKVKVNDYLFVLHHIKTPIAYDSIYAFNSAKNMKASMIHLGYYRAKAEFKADTVKTGQMRRVALRFIVTAGPPTLIDTISYNLKRPLLQQLSDSTQQQSLLKVKEPITKANVLDEIARLVALYRNNGYYKFTPDNLRLRGDTTIEALTSVGDDPFENIRKIAEANAKRDKPTIKLSMVLNQLPTDSSKLRKYYIDSIQVYPDFTGPDSSAMEEIYSQYTIRYHYKFFRDKFLTRNFNFKSGDIFKQDDFAKTISNFSKTGVWKNINIIINDSKKDSDKINIIVQLMPAPQYGFEANLEASYSANSNTNNATVASYAGNLFGISGNISLQNRNWIKEGINMTHAFRSGIELNLSSDKNSGRTINSNDVSYNNNISIPRIVSPFKSLNNQQRFSQHSFINTNIAYTNRIDLYNMQSISSTAGWEWSPLKHPNRSFYIKPINVEFSFLYNQSDSFNKTLATNPYLRYSFNTALVVGSSFGFGHTILNKKYSEILKFNIEESGFAIGVIPVGPWGLAKKYMRQYIKSDFEYTHIKNLNKIALVFHGFMGVGLPLSTADSSLPFFKQYYSGGANSMRGWPVRGIGPGAKPLAPYNTNTLNDRTGDIKLEANGEFRYNIAQNIFNTFNLKGVLFIDAGNVWNFRNTRPGGGNDSLQFNIKNLYKQLGVDAGTGFRIDVANIVIRIDLGFRFKHPEMLANDGWKAPSIGFDDLFPKLFSREYRQWRYENFNLNIGIGLPFQ